MTTYSNPRIEDVIENWPTGKHRTTAHFWIESDPKRGERACRTTAHPLTGLDSAPKKLTYATKMRIVDGDDGRTYIVDYSVTSRFVVIWRGDMKFNHETIDSRDPRYPEVMRLFE